jgi:hypothetical protein
MSDKEPPKFNFQYERSLQARNFKRQEQTTVSDGVTELDFFYGFGQTSKVKKVTKIDLTTFKQIYSKLDSKYFQSLFVFLKREVQNHSRTVQKQK